MNRTVFKTCTWLLWLALPVTALRYWMVWDQLPASVATHFNAAGQPNGWMTRETSLIFALVLTGFMLVVLTAVLYVIQMKNVSDAFSWAFLAFCWLMMGLVYYGSASIIAYNLHGQPVEVGPLLFGVPVLVIVLTAIYLGSKRGHPLPQQTWIAEEVHASKLWASVFALPIIVESVVFVAVPIASVRLGLGLMLVIFSVVMIHAWTGFHYRFGAYGVEISTLGFRLRSIPHNQIKEYAEKSWSPLRGYGIRGVGPDRAYVWGNRGVLIKTLSGEVFLGHNQPERIIHDLDAMKQYAHS